MSRPQMIYDEEYSAQDDCELVSSSEEEEKFSESDPEEVEPSLSHGIDIEKILNSKDLNIVMDEITCPVCQMLVYDPVVCKFCEACFCNICAESWLKKSNQKKDCPCCRGNYNHQQKGQGIPVDEKYYTVKVPKIIITLLSKIILECQYHSQGCSDVIKYQQYYKHGKTCSYQPLICPNKSCERKLLKKDMEDHLKECPYQLIECPFCKQNIKRESLDTHVTFCEYRLVECKYCQQSFMALQINYHVNDCDLKPVQCPTCFETYPQKEYKLHTPEVCYKMQFLALQKTQNQLKSRLENLETENQSLKRNCKYLSKEIMKYKTNGVPLIQKAEAEEEIQQPNKKSISSISYSEDFESLTSVDPIPYLQQNSIKPQSAEEEKKNSQLVKELSKAENENLQGNQEASEKEILQANIMKLDFNSVSCQHNKTQTEPDLLLEIEKAEEPPQRINRKKSFDDLKEAIKMAQKKENNKSKRPKQRRRSLQGSWIQYP